MVPAQTPRDGYRSFSGGDFRKEVPEIQSPVARRLFVQEKLNHLANLRMAEYEVVVATA
jgi:hypothetical protein